ncbi:MAG: YlmC/YmxH family sporulation protein [Clostridia bacterium]|nr:YlmC/YmxH family sporulation protein [Clostridia bacterium]
MFIKYSELKKKDVLNVETGKNLGKITDLVIDGDSGEIQKIITCAKKFSLLPSDSQEIDYCKITKIGDDVILISKRSKNCQAPCVEPSPCSQLAANCNCVEPRTFDEE